jgi:MSHA biogenesis protein MshJ
MKQLWEKINLKVGAMSRRERLLVFVTLAVVVVALLNALLLEPLFARQKMLNSQLLEQQGRLESFQSQISLMKQASSANANSPQRIQLNRIRQELDANNAFLQSSREKLVEPEKMAEYLRQLLNRNSRLQMVGMQTLPVTPLIEPPADKVVETVKTALSAVVPGNEDKQVFKHGVKLTVRGNYLDLLQYVKALESLPQQMFWAKAEMTVVQYPTAELSLILYTLSLDKIWLQI